ncbi:probable zinc metalloprotease EGY1, chloroplastic [Humulus lupulus]|uniref:probable zinc metalloprotease EGY1, chloroplastic n=1 Tax=Humulus lupulus TaxID=3486 RepID=UPI002B40BE24|nr:probable zinc metalloprotease EGY1, chloroplastic [Humulus lupulus]
MVKNTQRIEALEKRMGELDGLEERVRDLSFSSHIDKDVSDPPTPPSFGPAYNNFQVDSFKLMELLGPEKVDPADVKLIKDKLFEYSTSLVTKEEPFGDLGEGVVFVGNLRGNREEVFAKLQSQLVEVIGDKYNLFMVDEPNSEGPDPHGGPRVSFGLLQKEVSEPGPTTLWQYVIALLLFLITIGSSVELGIASQINSLPPEVVKYFTDPNAVEAPDMELLFPFVDSALPLAYGVLGVLLFHEVGQFLAAFPKKVKLSIPYFIPNITLGSFGAITQMRNVVAALLLLLCFKSILPDQSAQVDISLAGPFAGAALSFSMFVVGLLLSSNPDATGDLVQRDTPQSASNTLQWEEHIVAVERLLKDQQEAKNDIMEDFWESVCALKTEMK